MRVATVNYKIRALSRASDFVDHGIELLDRALELGAELVVFPECFTLETLALAPDYEPHEVAGLIPYSLVDPLVDYAQTNGIAFCAGSTFLAEPSGTRNVSPFHWPDGRHAIQPKMTMTQYELVDWGLASGQALTQNPDPRFGTLICYDSEFPEAGRVLSESGVICLCVPAYTETEHGFWRVRNSCLARAIENQIFVIHSSLVGSLGREPIPQAHGSSAILAPSVAPFPPNGILVESEWDEEAVVVAELDFEALMQARNAGDVRNWHDRDPARWRQS